MLKILEVFAGSQTLGNLARSHGHQVLSIDTVKYNTSSPDTLLIDNLDFNYKDFHPTHFNILFFDYFLNL